MGFGAIPLFLFMIIPAAYIVWASTTMIKLQREKIELLKSIDSKMN
ncbi:hypothetical protein RCG24_13490 [Neobacillus sp. OS1-32]|jgi:hypothetical protein|uniref:Uncharacterized protein n=1 Tax=Neobacillus paridis TaxID=2803862 RepID=A0ABS1TU47_9BACI|nr:MULTISPECIES: hypothetical protein [Neobacillus]MBL4954837.1 hypothetical protein [Neobacillus paridis]WML29026.1 hypothetical protein RCG24_13490 [Neobacillus sp. OS1-32]